MTSKQYDAASGKVEREKTKGVPRERVSIGRSGKGRLPTRELLALVRRRYPRWSGFSDADFLKEEIDPRQATVHRARELLGEGDLQDLLDQGGASRGVVAEDRFDEFIRRLELIGQDNNLLWRRVPGSGDLGILYHSRLDKPTFCLAVFDLLYGPGDSPARLERYLNYVRAHKLPNRWTFPTYFLFVCHPETEIFIKPVTLKWFCRFIGKDELWKATPSAAGYAFIRDVALRLKNALQKQGPHDMVDVQSLLWVARSADTGSIGRRQSAKDRSLDNEAAVSQPLVSLSASLPAVLPSPTTNANASYTLAQCAEDVGMGEATLAKWIEAIERKGQAIFYGPPGTGKTFLATHLARYLAAEDGGFWEAVQFHPAYAYEDFIQGIRPQPNASGRLAYPLVPGRFLDFCARAAATRGRCVLVIDEINRADLSQVLGELMFLLEYREQAIPLAGGGIFHIPGNVRLLGTMNTANRSIAILDQALRRRFAFLPVEPNFDVLRLYHERTGSDVTCLIAVLMRINQAIGDPHQALGMTSFLLADLPLHMEGIWRFEIEPYLEEHFFDRAEEIEEFRWDNVKSKLLS